MDGVKEWNKRYTDWRKWGKNKILKILFANDMIIYIENPRNWPLKTPERQVTATTEEHKSIHESQTLLHQWRTESEIKNTIIHNYIKKENFSIILTTYV